VPRLSFLLSTFYFLAQRRSTALAQRGWGSARSTDLLLDCSTALAQRAPLVRPLHYLNAVAPLRALLFPLPRYAGGGRGWGLQCLTVLLMCSSIALAQRCTQIKSLSISNGRYSSIPLFVAVHFSGDKNLDEIAKGSTKTVGALASRQCT